MKQIAKEVCFSLVREWKSWKMRWEQLSPNQVLLSKNFRSRLRCRQKCLVRKPWVGGGGQNSIFIQAPLRSFLKTIMWLETLEPHLVTPSFVSASWGRMGAETPFFVLVLLLVVLLLIVLCLGCYFLVWLLLVLLFCLLSCSCLQLFAVFSCCLCCRCGSSAVFLLFCVALLVVRCFDCFYGTLFDLEPQENTKEKGTPI